MDEFFARNRLSAYLDGELPSAEAREVEDALARSPALRAELDQLRAGIALLRAGGPVPAPRNFARKLEARLAEEPLRVGWVRHLHKVRIEAVMLAAAAALVLVFAGRKVVPEAEPPPIDFPAEVAALDPADPAAAPLEEPLIDDLRHPSPAVDVARMPGVEPAITNAPDSANGVLGDEKLAKKSAPSKSKSELLKEQSFASKGTKSGRTSAKSGVEKEAYVTPWEQQGTPPDAPPTVQAPPQFRLTLTSDTGLRDLDAIARQYGGYLADSRGKQLGSFLIEQGETRKFKLVMPASTLSAGQLYERLKELGHAELVSDGTFYAGSASAPVIVEVSRE